MAKKKATEKTSKKTAGKTTKKTTKKASKKAPSAKKTSAKKASPRITTRKKAAGTSSGVKRKSALKIGTEATSMIGVSAPKMIRQATGGQNLSLADFAGKRVVLYFYPKDNTPGCTLEGYDFKRLQHDFEIANTVILGVSKDSVKTHEGFKSKCGFPFELLSDPDEQLARAFDVIQMKSLYGRQYLGIERSTFVIDEEGTVVREWRKVKVNGHAEEVLDYVRTL